MKKLFVGVLIFLGLNSVHGARLAEREVLKRQLLSVEDLKEYFLERILKCAGTDKNPNEIAGMFLMAQFEFLGQITKNKPPDQALSTFLRGYEYFQQLTPELIIAILPEDRLEAEQANYLYSQAAALINERNEVTRKSYGITTSSLSPEGKFDL